MRAAGRRTRTIVRRRAFLRWWLGALPHGGARFFAGVFWLGDLNYRVNGNRAAVDALLAPPGAAAKAEPDWAGPEEHWDRMRAVLLANDQLGMAMRNGQVFGGYAEGEIRFRPTYKFDKREPEAYDRSEKQRIPAYTDRVLWRPAPAGWAAGEAVPVPGPTAPIRLLRYDSVEALKTSDHKPVVAEFEVAYRGGAAEEPTPRTHPALRKGGVHGAARAGAGAQTSSTICAVM
jgi:hypothetical protein